MTFSERGSELNAREQWPRAAVLSMQQR